MKAEGVRGLLNSHIRLKGVSTPILYSVIPLKYRQLSREIYFSNKQD
jgi:hypothetical protein